jgi:hypothetical protein
VQSGTAPGPPEAGEALPTVIDAAVDAAADPLEVETGRRALER